MYVAVPMVLPTPVDGGKTPERSLLGVQANLPQVAAGTAESSERPEVALKHGVPWAP